MCRFIIRHKVFFIIILSLLFVKVIWVNWSCWGNGSFDSEKNDLLQRRNYLVGKIVVEPRKLLNEMPGGIDAQFQGEWALYSCSMLAEALSNMAELYPETKDSAVALIQASISDQSRQDESVISRQRRKADYHCLDPWTAEIRGKWPGGRKSPYPATTEKNTEERQ